MIKDEVRLSEGFKTQTKKAITAIFIFAFVYILLFISALGLTALCVYGGIMLVVAVPRFITIALGIGLASTGFLVIFFLLKFIFKTNKVDRAHLTEITEKDQPALFKMIHEIVTEVGTSFPKKVYISPEVNASVFYDSSFWSMFFPIKKNLMIGLGLVNSIHSSELKAILSHEFGHFSQKTMKVGSYVYNVNQIIFNMLYDNEGYDRAIQNWANASGYFAIFVIVAVKIVQGIQWILRKLYEFVNKNYLGLSREMEFHADEIAANVTGFMSLKNSLLRMNISDYSFNQVMSYYEAKISENVKSKNVFAEQTFLLGYLAQQDDLPLTDGLPKVTLEDLNKFNKSKLVIKDQWASHPSTEERIAHLEKTQLISEDIDTSLAISLFENSIELQEQITKKMFSEVKYEESPTANTLEQFQLDFIREYDKTTFSKRFNGYYNDKNPIAFDVSNVGQASLTASFETFFDDHHINEVYEALALENDIEILQQIGNGTLPIKTFDYDGKKYKRKKGSELVKELKIQLDALTEKIKQNDIAIFQFFQKLETQQGGDKKLAQLYINFFEYDKEYDGKIAIYGDISEKLQFISQNTPLNDIRDKFNALRAPERTLKESIKVIMKDEKYTSELTLDIKDSFEKYLSKHFEYFGNERYFDDNLEILFKALNNYAILLNKGYFLNKKEILDYKLSILS